MKRASLLLLFVGCNCGPDPKWSRPTECLDAASCEAACNAGNADGCADLAEKLFRGERVAYDSMRAESLLERACAMGSPSGCDRQASLLMGEPSAIESKRNDLRKRAFELRKARCESHDLSACRGYLSDLKNGWNEKTKEGQAEAAAQKLLPELLKETDARCDKSDARSCMDAARYIKGFTEPLPRDDLERASERYERACTLDNKYCWSFGNALVELGQAARGLELVRKACETDPDASNCEAPAGARSDVPLAELRFVRTRAACAEGFREACMDLLQKEAADAVAVRSASERRGDYDVGMLMLERECERGERRSCSYLAVRIALDAEDGAPRGLLKLKMHLALERACELGMYSDCKQVALGSLLRDVTALYPGHSHSCAQKSDKMLVCWGFGKDGAFGVASDKEDGSAILTFEAPIEDVAVFGSSSCALLTGGGVHCWGKDPTNPTKASSAPQPLVGLGGVKAIAGGDEFCVLTADRKATCYGRLSREPRVHNEVDAIYADERVSVRSGDVLLVDGLRGAPQVRVEVSPKGGAWQAGLSALCSLSSGAVRCGAIDLNHGRFEKDFTLNLEPVPEIEDAVEISVTHMFGCARRANGHVVCWGLPRGQPKEIAGIDDATSLKGSCATTKRGFVFCWGIRNKQPWGVAEPLLIGESAAAW